MTILSPSRKLACCLLTAAIVGCSEESVCAQAIRASKDRFLHEAPIGWQEHGLLTERVQGSTEIKSHTIKAKEKKLERHTTAENKRSGPWAYVKRVEHTPQAKNGLPVGAGWVVNSHYYAALQKKTKDVGWLLTDLELFTEGGMPKKTANLTRGIGFNTAPLLAVERKLLPELIKNPTFVLKEVITMPNETGEELVRVSFSVDRPLNVRSEDPRMDGWVVLDPARQWIVKEGRLKLMYAGNIPAEYAFENEYRHVRESFVIPTRSVQHIDFPKDDPGGGWLRQDEVETRFEFHEQDTSAEVEFSLTAFGLPEPVGITIQQPPRWHLWFGLGGIGCIAAGAACYHLARRAGIKRPRPDASGA